MANSDGPNVQFDVTEDAAVTFATSVLINDSDPDTANGISQSLSVSTFTQPSKGVVTHLGGGTFRFDPNNEFHYLDANDPDETVTFTYRITDGEASNNLSDSATVSVRVEGVNDAPEAFGTNENITVNIGGTASSFTGGGTSVLSNDTDVDIEDLDVSIVTLPEFGTLSMDTETGTFSYTHNGTNNLSDSFQYRVSDGTTLSAATITVPISITNTPPTAVNDLNAATIAENGSVNLNVLANDTDPETKALAQVVNIGSQTNGSAVIQGDQTVTFTHDGSNTTSGSFTYQISDPYLPSLNTATVTISVNRVNDLPIITGISNPTINEDTTLDLILSVTDEEDAGSNLTWSISSPANHGVASVSGTGASKTISYTPELNNTTQATFTVSVTDRGLNGITDGDDGTANFPVTVNITPQQDDPIILLSDGVTDAGATVNVTMAEDNDVSNPFALTLDVNEPDGDTVTWGIVGGSVSPGASASTSSGTGSQRVINYSPPANFNGTDTFQVIAEDLVNARSDTVIISVDIQAINDSPVIKSGNSTPSVQEEATLNLPIVVTDQEQAIQIMSWSISVNAANGTVSVPANGIDAGLDNSNTVIYTPNANFFGDDNFTVLIEDSGTPTGSVSFPVTVTVNNENDNPIILEGDSLQDDLRAVTMAEDNDISNPFSLTLDVDEPDNEGVTWTASGSSAQSGTFTTTAGTGTQRIINYSPPANYSGPDSFQITATDAGLLSDTVTVNVTIDPVNDAPEIDQGAAITSPTADTPEDIPLNLNLSVTDPEGGTFNWTQVLGFGPNNGTLTLPTGSSAAETIIYTPNLDYTGPDAFRIQVEDSTGLTDVIDVSLQVTPLNDPPTIDQAGPVARTMNEDDPSSFVLQLSATDVDLDLISWSIVSPGASNGVASVDVGTTANGILKTINYTPNPNFTGSDSFTVRATANAQSTTILVNVTVDPVEDLPEIAGANPVVVAISEDGNPQPFNTLTLTASDGDGDVLTWSLLPGATKGVPSITPNGNSADINYTPTANENGTGSFQVQVSDGDDTDTVTVQVNITPVDDGPTIDEGSSLSVNVTEDTSLSFELNATDIELDPIGWSIPFNANDGVASLDDSSGSTELITYTPDANFTGTDTFTVRASAAGKPVDIVITANVQPVNDAPVITQGTTATVNMSEDGDPTPFNLTLNATDVEGSDLTWSINSLPTDGTASIPAGIGNSKVVSYQPDANFFGQDSFVLTVSDGTDSSSITVTVNVAAVDDLPVITEGDAITVDMSEDESPIPFGLTLTASDVENHTITWDIQSNAANGIASVSATPTGETQVINYIPNADFNGTDNFTVRITANTQVDTINVTVNVEPVNDAPVITQGSADTVNMSEDSNPNAFALTLDATDTEGDTLTWSISGAASNGVASVTPNVNSAAVNYTPDTDYNGSDSFTVQVSDGTDTATFDVTVNINPVNDAPVITQGANVDVTMSEDGAPDPFSLILNATDVEVNTITWSISSAATNGAASVSATPTGETQVINYVPNTEFSGSDSFQVTASDGLLDTAITVNVNVVIVNDAPVLADIADVEVNEEVPLTVKAVATDVDDSVNGTDVVYSLVSPPAGMSISNVNDATLGDITWTPPQTGEFDKAYQIVVNATDGGEDGALAASKTFVITVQPPDADGDKVADYNDFCPAIADSTNADNDGDGTAGSDSDPNDSVGGDVCDSDDDNDTMPDTYEENFNLDPKDASDALADKDGDGISNVDEFNNGTNPLFPIITVNSTGYFTEVELIQPEPSYFDPEAATVTLDNPGPFRPGQHVVIWRVFDSKGVTLIETQQEVNVIPLVNFSANQITLEGNTANVDVILNGDAAEYPVIVNYTVQGSADISDHDAIAGSATIASGTSTNIPVVIFEDGPGDAGETVVLRMSSADNAVLGAKQGHRIRIEEGNLAPDVDIVFSQNGNDIGQAYASDGTVTIEAVVSDQNTGQSHSYDWQDSDAALNAPSDALSNSWTLSPSVGTFNVEVIVTDDGNPAQSTTVSKILKVVSGAAPALTAADSDGDGTDDATEGHGDSDDDGIPNYLDAINDGNLLQDGSSSPTQSHLLQTEDGLKLKIGRTARAAGIFGAAVTQNEIVNFGGKGGTASSNGQDDREHVSGVYDFEVKGVEPGTSAFVVIPLQVAIPKDATFRKFDEDSGWTDYVDDGTDNVIFSADGNFGVCPEPGSDLYQPGLGFLHTCIQLLIQDGGPNDQDGQANGVIKDPATVAFRLTDPEQQTVREGAGRVALDILLFLLMLMLIRWGHQQWAVARGNQS